jgi:hypothetical protein
MIVKRYSAEEIDLIAAYCAELDRCYVLPAREFASKRFVHLRRLPSRNNQMAKINAAAEYEFDARLRRPVEGP